MIRREGCKEKTLSFFKDMISNKRDIMSISYVFNKFLEVLRRAEDEKSQDLNLMAQMCGDALKDANVPPSKLPETSPNVSNQRLTIALGGSHRATQVFESLKTSSSYNIVQQADIHYKIFAPLAEDKEFDKEYLTKLIMEYIRLSADNGVPVMSEIQAVFIRLVLQIKDFPLLQSLLQFHCLRDNIDLAEILIKLGTKDKSAFQDKQENELIEFVEDEYIPELLQTGIDMYYRMGKLKDILEHLLSNESVRKKFNQYYILY